MLLQAREGASFIPSHEAGVADDISRQDDGKLSLFAHPAPRDEATRLDADGATCDGRRPSSSPGATISGELQLGDIKMRRSVVLKVADGSAVSGLAWSPDGFHLAAGNDNGDLLVIDLRR